MTTVKLCGIAIVAVMLIVTLKQLKAEFALPATIVSSIIIFTVGLSCLAPAIEYLNSILNSATTDYIIILMKSLGIALLTQTTSDICRDSGETSVAAKIEFAGKAEILVLSLPLIAELLEISHNLLIR